MAEHFVTSLHQYTRRFITRRSAPGNDWLDEATYGAAARRSWIAVAGYVDQNHDVTQVCEGTGKKDDLDYYLARRRCTGDFHGQAPVLWAATALLRDGQ